MVAASMPLALIHKKFLVKDLHSVFVLDRCQVGGFVCLFFQEEKDARCQRVGLPGWPQGRSVAADC